MKKKTFLLMIILLVGIFIPMIKSINTKDKLIINKKKSYYSSYEIVNDTVLVKCYISIINNNRDDKTISLSAILPDDVSNGLLRYEELPVINENGEEAIFIIQAKTENSFYVTFVGEYAGKNQKYDRRLPEIEIKIIE